MSQEKPAVYSSGFSASALMAANETDQPVVQTTRDLGINENMRHPPESVKTADLSEMQKRRVLSTIITKN